MFKIYYAMDWEQETFFNSSPVDYRAFISESAPAREPPRAAPRDVPREPPRELPRELPRLISRGLQQEFEINEKFIMWVFLVILIYFVIRINHKLDLLLSHSQIRLF